MDVRIYSKNIYQSFERTNCTLKNHGDQNIFKFVVTEIKQVRLWKIEVFSARPHITCINQDCVLTMIKSCYLYFGYIIVVGVYQFRLEHCVGHCWLLWVTVHCHACLSYQSNN